MESPDVNVSTYTPSTKSVSLFIVNIRSHLDVKCDNIQEENQAFVTDLLDYIDVDRTWIYSELLTFAWSQHAHLEKPDLTLVRLDISRQQGSAAVSELIIHIKQADLPFLMDLVQ